MNETIFDWDDLRLFLAVARGGGLAGAKESTGKSAPTLGRRMLALERRLGRDLFHRLPRGYALTEEGQCFLDQILALETRLLPIVDRKDQENRPLIKISAGSWVSAHLCKHMDQILGDAAARLRFIAADEVVDIGRREALVGIRNAPPTDTALAGRRIGRVQFAVYARGPGVQPWARVMAKTPSARWVADKTADAPVIEVTHPRNALDLAQAGVARAVLPTFVGDDESGLMRISDPIDALDHAQWLVMHHEDRHLPPVRAVINRLFTVLKGISKLTERMDAN